MQGTRCMPEGGMPACRGRKQGRRQAAQPPRQATQCCPAGHSATLLGWGWCPADAPPQLPLYKLPHNQQACSPQHQFPQQKRLAWVTGEKRTQDTHSVWPSGSPMVYLHSPAGRR